MGMRGGFVIAIVAIIAIILGILALMGPGFNALEPTPSPRATATSTPTPTPAPTLAPPPAATTTPTPFETTVVSRMAPPTDLAADSIEQTQFILEFQYPTAGEVEPTHFNIDVNGQTYDTYDYEGVGARYSLIVDGQQCGSTVRAQVVAVNGEDTASSDVEQVQMLAC